MSESYNNFLVDLKNKRDLGYDIVFICIGTDRVIGDCIGPVTGSLLKNKFENAYIYGDLEENITFSNIEEKIHQIKVKYVKPYIVAIDAALSEEENIGEIFVDKSGVRIGHGLFKQKYNVGNVGIKAVVGKDFNDRNLNFRALQNVSLGKILSYSKQISEGIINTMNK